MLGHHLVAPGVAEVALGMEIPVPALETGEEGAAG